MSTSSDTVAARVLGVLGVGDDDRFTTFAGRMEHRDDIEALFVDWCAARDSADVITTLTEAHAAVGPVMDMSDIADDPHFRERATIADVADQDGMVTPMQSLIAKLSATPGELRWSGRTLDADGDAIRAHGWAAPRDER